MSDKQLNRNSDRGMKLAEWQDWIVDLLIKKHDEGCSDNQLRMIFAVEFDRCFGTQPVTPLARVDDR